MALRRTLGWQRLRVTALVVIGSLLLAYGVYRVGKIFDVFASRYTLIMLVPSVAGLREGAPVTLAGQRVGQVKNIEFIPVERKVGAENLTLELEDLREGQESDPRRLEGIPALPGIAGRQIRRPHDRHGQRHCAAGR